MKKLLTPLLTIPLLLSCVHTEPDQTYVSETNIQNVEKIFVGIPWLLGAEGSAVRLNEEWMITATHNALIMELKFEEVYYHPTCDIAVYRDKGEGKSKVGNWNFGETLYSVGYPTLQHIKVREHKYLQNVVNPDRRYKDCIVAATEGKSTIGQSGGGVYNDRNELVGIVHGKFTTLENHDGSVHTGGGMLFTSLYVVRDWLYEITGEKYFE